MYKDKVEQLNETSSRSFAATRNLDLLGLIKAEITEMEDSKTAATNGRNR